MRVLVAFDREYRAYGQFIADAIRRARPHARVEAVDSGLPLEEAVDRSDPHLVICNEPVPDNPVSSRPAWVELSADPQRPSRIRLGDYRWETTNPSLEELLGIVDEAEKRSHSYEDYLKGWERFMEAERNALLDRVHGRLARALGRALPGEDREEIDKIADEDRRLAREGMVRLMHEDGEVVQKHIDRLEPQDAAARIRAERALWDWLIARTEECYSKLPDR